MLCQTILLFHFLHLFHSDTSRQIYKIELRVAMMMVGGGGGTVEVISNPMQLKLKIQVKSIRVEREIIYYTRMELKWKRRTISPQTKR